VEVLVMRLLTSRAPLFERAHAFSTSWASCDGASALGFQEEWAAARERRTFDNLTLFFLFVERAPWWCQRT
jgi:hypothetical protein